MTLVVINENGAIICNQKVISDKFNDYFVNLAQNLLRELGIAKLKPNNNFQDYLKIFWPHRKATHKASETFIWKN